MIPCVTREDWLLKRTFDGSRTDPAALGEQTGANRLTVSVVIPALNVAGTVGAICHTIDRKSTRLNSSHIQKSRMPSSA